MTEKYRTQIDIGLARKQIGDAVGKLTRKIALDVLTGVVNRTPVDTGRARGNWQVEIGGPARGTVERLDPSGAATMTEGTDKIEGTAGLVRSIHITNNLPYIQALENGSSEQAPHGMAAVTVNEIKEKLSRL